MIKISFVGDLMCEKEQLLANKVGNEYDFSPVFVHVKSVFETSDYVGGNLETPIAGEELGYTNHKWNFNSPIDYAQAISDAGFNLVSTANNHCMDRGTIGIAATIESLDKIGLEHIGTYKSRKDKETTFIKNINGVKIAFLAYTYGTNADLNKNYLNRGNKYLVNLFRNQERTFKFFNRRRYIMWTKGLKMFNVYLRKLNRDIRIARKQADFVILLMHSGGQYNLLPDKWTCKLLDHLIYKRVNVVIGSHPHVVQKGLHYSNNKVGFFSLGNFCSYPGSETSGPEGLKTLSEYSIILHLYINPRAKVVDRITFQIAKSVVDTDGRANIYLLFDLIQQELAEIKQAKLLEDNCHIVNRLIDENHESIIPQKEYIF